MTLPAIIELLTRLDVSLSVEGENLRFRAPAGVMTPALKDKVSQHKGELIAYLGREANPLFRTSPWLFADPDDLYAREERAAIMEYDGGLDRAAAEKAAGLSESFKNMKSDEEASERPRIHVRGFL